MTQMSGYQWDEAHERIRAMFPAQRALHDQTTATMRDAFKAMGVPITYETVMAFTIAIGFAIGTVETMADKGHPVRIRVVHDGLEEVACALHDLAAQNKVERT